MDKLKTKRKTKSEIQRNLLKYLKQTNIIESGGDNLSDDEDSYGKLSIASNEEVQLTNQQIVISRLKNKIKYLEQEINILETKENTFNLIE